ncbi:hypothetical protein E2C01_033689 [Portunus trituberculatus]|uniref:Uncharacterized protein n=1 Tax=Portunus trituberculatus TaxID=210409 RepID=A0A5B7F6B1_PORTR|nr:hypothetical protein [Portunus trituberculatus]
MMLSILTPPRLYCLDCRTKNTTHTSVSPISQTKCHQESLPSTAQAAGSTPQTADQRRLAAAVTPGRPVVGRAAVTNKLARIRTSSPLLTMTKVLHGKHNNSVSDKRIK